MKRHLAGVVLAALLVGVWALFAGLKAEGLEARRAAFAVEAMLRFWPEVMWRGSWVYPGQRAGMFATYGFVAPNGAALAVTVALLILWSGIAVRLAGVGRMLLVLAGAWIAAPALAAVVAPQTFGGASGAVYGLAGATFVWSMRRGDRETAGLVGLTLLTGIAGHALAGGQVVALDAAGLAAGAFLGLVVRMRNAAPEGGA